MSITVDDSAVEVSVSQPSTRSTILPLPRNIGVCRENFEIKLRIFPPIGVASMTLIAFPSTSRWTVFSHSHQRFIKRRRFTGDTMPTIFSCCRRRLLRNRLRLVK